MFIALQHLSLKELKWYHQNWYHQKLHFNRSFEFQNLILLSKGLWQREWEGRGYLNPLILYKDSAQEQWSHFLYCYFSQINIWWISLGEFRNLSKQNSHPAVPKVLPQSWEKEVQKQPESHRKLWVISKGILSSGFCTAGPGGTTGREDGDMYSVSSSLSDCSPGGSFGTGSGLEAGETRYKTFTANLINTLLNPQSPHSKSV